MADSIWRLTEEVLELLRTQATNQVRRHKRRNVLWVDDVTRAQGNTVIAVKQLCDQHPEGTTLKTLAETMGVSPAAASVMVEVLVGKRMLERSRSRSDRRSILIRLTPQTSRLFDTSDRSLRESVVGLADSLDPQFLYEWQATLVTASSALRQALGTKAAADSASADSAFNNSAAPEFRAAGP